MLLERGNLKIRDALASDARQLALWWNDGAVMAHAGFPNGTGQTEREIADSLKRDSDATRRRLIIEIDGAAAGEMNYRSMGGGTAEIGIKLCDASKQNRGLGKILLSMLISSLFDDLGYRRIILDTNLKNERAQHVYERLGFARLGVRENSWTDQTGALQSAVDYELYKEAFNNFAPPV